MKKAAFVFLCLTLSAPLAHAAGGAQADVLAKYAAEAKAADPSFSGFSGERGKAFFYAEPGTGKPDTPGCTSCHSKNPKEAGQTRAGKEIGPMALSAKGDRYTDMVETEKWFKRNCDSVLGRQCTPAEKGDFITFMISQ
jgi:hypothetical protein